MNQINLHEVRKTISELVESAALDYRVIDALKLGDILVPKECELWDYKAQANRDAGSLGETVLEIVSFYNAYGGYLLYGVEETKADLEFIPIGIPQGSLSAYQLRQLARNYTGSEIDLTYVELLSDFAGNKFLIGLLHIPKRPRWQAPAIFGKNGPEKNPGHCLFKKGSIYVRLQDRCIPAETKEDLQFLYGKRYNPFLFTRDSIVISEVGVDVLVDQNLPERNFICPKFFGRDEIIAELWRWLADDLDRTRVLAGDGGKGKTSIAYEFAEEVCRTKPYEIEKVVWLTAKIRQFKGELGKFVSVPRTDYSDTESMLKALCSELAIMEGETEGANIPLLKRQLNSALSQIACLIVIDDVDTTDPDEQRKIMETAMQFPNSRARFLLTTRKNIIYSSASCITVGGLSKEDYHDFTNHKMTELGIPPLKTRQIDKMLTVTDGSPLYTESLLRLCHLGMPIEVAMEKWKGKLGSEVREAALHREIEQLLLESKRVLLACALMGEASLTELKKVTGYDDNRMMVCLEELKSLFLINVKPFIKQEPRFAVSNSTSLLVLENREMLVPDPAALEKTVVLLRTGRGSGSKRVMITRRSVGSAISQAVALLKASKHKDAIETTEAALLEFKNDPDLTLARGRCLLAYFYSCKEAKYLTMARKAFSKAYNYGQRREMLYELWYESEMTADHTQGAIDVCTFAIKDKLPSYSTWLRRRADAYALLSMVMRQSFNINGAIINTRSRLTDLNKAMSQSGILEKTEVNELFYQASDDLWEMLSSISGDIVGIRDLFQAVQLCISLGDSRPITLQRLVHTAERAYQKVLPIEGITRPQANLLRQIVRETGEVLASHLKVSSDREMLKGLQSRWQTLDSATAHMDN